MKFTIELLYSIVSLSNEYLLRACGFLYTDRELLKYYDLAENSLKIFVYDNPANISGCQQPREYFMFEQMFPDYIERSAMVTKNASDADLFLVRHDLVCAGLSQFHNESFQQLVIDKIWSNFKLLPYIKRRNGIDHVFIFVCDNGILCDSPGGACHFPTKYVADIQNMIIMGNYGYEQSSHPLTTETQNTTSWTKCFRPNHDIVIPQPHKSCETVTDANQQLASPRPILSSYFGSLIAGSKCSAGARLALRSLKRTLISNSTGVIQTLNISARKHRNVFAFQGDKRAPLRSSFFSFCPAGHACWSARTYDAICSLSIPIIVADGVVEPFERFFDWTAFSMKVSVSDLGPDLLAHLRSFLTWNPTESSPWSIAPLSSSTSSLSASSLPSKLSISHKPIGWSDVQNNPIYQKLLALKAVRPWFSWNQKREKNMYKLLIIELFCRTDKGKSALPDLCNSPDAYVHNRSYLS